MGPPKEDSSYSLIYRFIINDIGYQVDVYYGDKVIGSSCRDFGRNYDEGSKEHDELINDLNERLWVTIDAWRKNH